MNFSHKLDKSYLLLCLVLLPAVVFFSFARPWGMGYDIWDTAAAIRELSVHPLQPEHHLYLLPGNTSPRFSPYTLFWGVFKKITGLGIFACLGIAAILNYLLFILGLYLFVTSQFRRRSLPTLTFLSMLLIWGSGYAHANAYHLEKFLDTLPYVSTFTFGLSLNALFFLNRYCKTSKKLDLFIYCFLSILAFVTHPITGSFCFVVTLAKLIDDGNLKKMLFLQSAPLFALGASLIWPYFSYWDVFTKNSVTTLYKSPLFSNQIVALGPALVSIPIIILYASRKKHRFLLYGFSLCFLIYIISGWGNLFAGGRYIFFTAFFLHLAIALYLVENKIFALPKIKSSWKSDGAVIILIFILIAPSGYYRARETGRHILRFIDKPFRVHSYEYPVKSYLFLSKHLAKGDVVLSSGWRDGYVIPALTGAKIVEPRRAFSLLIKDEADRRKKDAEAFFKDILSTEERMKILEKYRVTHILINLNNEEEWDPSFRRDLNTAGEEIATENSLVLFRISRPLG